MQVRSRQYPATPRYREELARNLNNQGTLLKLVGKTSAAETCYTEAKDLCSVLAREDDKALTTPGYMPAAARMGPGPGISFGSDRNDAPGPGCLPAAV